MYEVNSESVNICIHAIERFERKVWLSRCQQDIEVAGKLAEYRTIFVDDSGFLYLCQNLDGGGNVISHVLPEEWNPRHAA